MTEKEKLLYDFDELVIGAPMDFLGTGSDSKAAEQEEADWHALADSIKSRLEEWIEEFERLEAERYDETMGASYYEGLLDNE